MNAATEMAVIPAPSRRLSVGEQFVLSLHWFGLNFHWGALLAVVIPVEVLRFVPDEYKGRALALVFALGALVALVTMPLAGALSDRWAGRLGRRRPFIIVGALLNAAALLALAAAPRLLYFVPAFLLVQFANNFGGSAYSGLIPDFVPEEQRGSASGFMGLMIILGSIGGSAVAGVLIRDHRLLVYLIIIAVLLTTMLLTVWLVHEQPLRRDLPFQLREFLAGFWIDPRRHPNFAWLFSSRIVALMGFYTLLAFLLLFVKYYLKIAPPERATGILSVAVSLGALGSGFLLGRLSDRIGRRSIVSASTLVMAAALLLFLTAPSFRLALILGFIFGIGYGGLVSVEWALAIDVLPSREEAAKYLGIWGISGVLPQVIAPTIGGLALDGFNMIRDNLGFVVLMIMAAGYMIVGSVLIWKIRGIR